MRDAVRTGPGRLRKLTWRAGRDARLTMKIVKPHGNGSDSQTVHQVEAKILKLDWRYGTSVRAGTGSAQMWSRCGQKPADAVGP